MGKAREAYNGIGKPSEMMTDAEYQAAIHVKSTSIWDLHIRRVRGTMRPLNFFTLLSSVAGVVGSEDRVNYAAASTFLDAFASSPQSIGP